MAAMTDLADRVRQLTGRYSRKKFEEELDEVQRLVESLQAEQAALRDQNSALAAENARLKEALAALEQGTAPAEERATQISEALEEIAEKILIDISNNETPKESIVTFFQLTKSKGDHYFDLLAKRNFIRVKYMLDDDLYFVVTEEGQAYLENK